jgi:hypothetical protein
MNINCSMFSQILQFFPRLEFQNLVIETKSERHARGFSSWSQFVSMLFCQFGHAFSLREIAGGLRSCEGKLKHLGITAPAKSSLAYANEHRPWELYQEVFQKLFNRCQSQFNLGKRKFRFNNKLVSLDSTTIDLCLAIFDWAHYKRTKGAVKLHLLLDHDGYLPSFGIITDGKAADVKTAWQFKLEPGTIVVYDRGYNDYALFGHWTAQGIFFVTRMKDNAVYAVIKQNPTNLGSDVLKDEIIELTGVGAFEKCPYKLRRIEFYDDKTREILVFLTNHLRLSAMTIVAIYKDRWEIEKFFRYLKQNLKIKTFVGTSANAVRIQIWTALIAMLILQFLKLRSQYGWSLSNLVALLRMNLFTHRDLWDWINQPFEVLPDEYQVEQLRMVLT